MEISKGLKIRQLPTPIIIKRSLKMLFSKYDESSISSYYLTQLDTIVKGNLVLDPKYQRASVWDEARASTLITSVLSK